MHYLQRFSYTGKLDAIRRYPPPSQSTTHFATDQLERLIQRKPYCKINAGHEVVVFRYRCVMAFSVLSRF